MKITKITGQIKNPDRANIFIDGTYSFSLTLSQVIDNKVKVGLELDEAELNVLKKISDYGKLKMRTIEWLYIRPRSSQELRMYLKKKNVDTEDSTKLINEISKLGYQDDFRFTTWWIEQRKAKNKSNRFISNELRSKGIDSGTISDALNDSGETDEARMINLINKKNLLQKYPEKQKLVTYLMRQGFSYDVIKQHIPN
ncbi:RecX family transcriptional regulator [Candidatus Saccharibacteria bacterium]|nr:RecX family transcriptional regulator [Candidatus Saccharibacteria bacterium]MBP7835110.1 RecX family transcriptional regulator [Candidatus Saccharibacteria bacterium]